jgi:CarD family transcriptional regulator
VKFKKGDTVIYPQHGACIVHGIKRMKAFGAVQEYLILKTVINEMTLSVPTAMANQVGVRPPVSKSELEDLRSVLSKADPRVPANWSRRFKNHQEKLKSGDVYQVAEVVRNLAARDRDSALSAAEKTMYDRARINLISEISPALKVSTDAAEVWLDAALEQGVLKPSKGAKIVKQIPKDDAKPVSKAVAKDAAKPVAKAAKVAKVAKVAKAPAKAVAKKK